MMPFDPFNSFLFNFSSIFMPIIFIIVLVGFIFVFAKGIKTWSYNNGQPVLSVCAKVASKRTNVTSTMHNDNGIQHHSTSTTYYVTFEVESGDRMEFTVIANEYGMLVEGDTGKLTFQGTRYKGFNRDRGE
jgi:hypothetical protein